MAKELLDILIEKEIFIGNNIDIRKAEEHYYQLNLAKKHASGRNSLKKRHDVLQHGEHIAQCMGIIGKELGLTDDEIKIIGFASLLHDVGKLKIHDSILYKPGRLNDDEWIIMKKHPVYSESIILPFNYPAKLARHHHERYDGTGYPDGLKGDEIPIGSRIISVIDSFDAMTSDRPYRKAMDVDYALTEIMKGSGKQFDPRASMIFVRYFNQPIILI